MLEENNARQGFVDHSVFLTVREHLPAYLKDPITFFYLSGWRLGEMRELEWRDVDLAGKAVRLRPEISKNKDGRVLPLSGELLEIIERAKAQRRLDCSYVFHLDGDQVGDFKRSWATACRKAGVGKCWFTICAELRCATWCERESPIGSLWHSLDTKLGVFSTGTTS